MYTLQLHMYVSSVRSKIRLQDEDHRNESLTTGIPVAGETVIVNGRTYTWQTTLSAAGDLLLSLAGTDLAKRLENRQTLTDAINGLGKSNGNVHNKTEGADGVYATHIGTGLYMRVDLTASNPGLENSIILDGTALGKTSGDAWSNIVLKNGSMGKLPKEFEINDITVVYRERNKR